MRNKTGKLFQNIQTRKVSAYEYIKKNDKLKLYEALQQLDANTREVMYLRLTGDLTFKEIGKSRIFALL